MASQDQQERDEKRPNATSPGNEGARGSRGQANGGAQPASSTNAGGDERAPEQGTDLRDADAQGGGGAGSGSSRSA
jgi:hypothetical protein